MQQSFDDNSSIEGNSGSALSLLRSRLSITLDQFSSEIAERYGPFTDMTSNPAVLASLIASDTHIEHVRRVVARARLEAGGNNEKAAELAMDMLVVSLSKSILPHITGRVHAQISPRHALSLPDTLSHAHRLMRLFAQDGISPGRVCLQIPATGAGMAAAASLEKSGIRTSATTVFSIDQARAAANAGCLYVCPYWNEFAVQFQPTTFIEHDHPASDHPMSGVIKEIVSILALGDDEHKPLVMVVNVMTPKEALAISTLGVDGVSLAGNVIEEMAGGANEALLIEISVAEEEQEVNGVDPDSPMRSKGKSKLKEIDWIIDEGAALDQSIRSQESVSNKLEYAIRSFEECESKVAQVIRQMM